MSQKFNFDFASSLPVDIRLRRILLVDDDKLSRQMARRLLEQFSFTEVQEAVNGAEALEMLKTLEVPIDLLIVDLIMPVMDGFELIEHVRAGMHKQNAKIPIIVMSGRSDSTTLQRVRKLGINGFVTKPPQARNFFERIVAAMRTVNTKSLEPEVRKLT